MLRFIATRFVSMCVTLVVVSVLGFILINLPPGTYLDVRIAELQAQGTATSTAQIEALRARFGLDQPIYVQYWRWVSGFVRGDFGRSFRYNQEVSQLIGDRLWMTVAIAGGSILFSWLVAIPIGIYSAVRKNSWGDHIATFFGFIGLSVPNFLLALVLLVLGSIAFDTSLAGLFSPEFERAPWSLAKFLDLLKHLWIPIIVVGAEGTAQLVRIMRGNLLDTINMQYVTTARAKGLKERVVILKHAVRTALHPLIMHLGLTLPSVVSGSTVVSIVLALPTIGPMYFNALRGQDMYLAIALLMFLSFMLIIGNFLADLLLAWVDPRVRLE